MTDEYNPEITGKVTISLETYERWKTFAESMRKERNQEANRVKDIVTASKHLSEFLNHISKKVDNFQDLVDTFNETSDACEIRKDDRGRYKIKVL